MDGTNYSWSLVPQMPKGNLEIRNLPSANVQFSLSHAMLHNLLTKQQ